MFDSLSSDCFLIVWHMCCYLPGSVSCQLGLEINEAYQLQSYSSMANVYITTYHIPRLTKVAIWDFTFVTDSPTCPDRNATV